MRISCWKKAGLPIASSQSARKRRKSWEPERVGIGNMRADTNDPTAVRCSRETSGGPLPAGNVKLLMKSSSAAPNGVTDR